MATDLADVRFVDLCGSGLRWPTIESAVDLGDYFDRRSFFDAAEVGQRDQVFEFEFVAFSVEAHLVLGRPIAVRVEGVDDIVGG